MQLLLYKLKFPGNVGAIYRLAYNFQVEKIWALNCVGPDAQNTPKIERHKQIEIQKVDSLDFMEHFDRDIIKIALEHSYGNIKPAAFYNVLNSIKKDLLIAVGNEGYGIPQDELQKFDHTLSLESETMQSYNVSHALAIALHKIYYP